MAIARKKVSFLILLTLIISLLGVLVVILYDYSTGYETLASVPANVRITNVTDRAFTVSWKTETPSKGMIVYTDAEEFNKLFPMIGSRIAVDDRDFYQEEEELEDQFNNTQEIALSEYFDEYYNKPQKASEYYTHHVTLRNLKPNTRYKFLISDGVSYQIESAWFADDEFNYNVNTSVSTLDELDEFSTPQPAYGSVVSSLPGFVNDGISFMNIEYKDGQDGADVYIPISAVVSDDGKWYMDLSNIRDNKGGVHQFDAEKHYERFFIEGGDFGRSVNYNLPPDQDAPAMPVELLNQLPDGYDYLTQKYNYLGSVAGLNTSPSGSNDYQESSGSPDGVIDSNCTGTGASLTRCDYNPGEGSYFLCTENGWQRVGSCPSDTAPGGTRSDTGDDLGGGGEPSGNFPGSAPSTNGPVQYDPNAGGWNGVENAARGGPGAGCSKGRSCAASLQCMTCGLDTYLGDKWKISNPGGNGIEVCLDPSRDLKTQCGGEPYRNDATPFDYKDDQQPENQQVPWQYREMAARCSSDQEVLDIQARCMDNLYNNADRCTVECHGLDYGCNQTGELQRNCCGAGMITTDPMCDSSADNSMYCPEACPNGNPFPEEMRKPFSDESQKYQEENEIRVTQFTTGPEQTAEPDDVPFQRNDSSGGLLQKVIKQVSAVDEVYLEPKEGIVFVEDSGEYCTEHDGSEYCAEIDNPGQKKLFIDTNENGIFDEGIDLLVAEDDGYIKLSVKEEYFQREIRAGLNLVSLPVLKKDKKIFKASEFLEMINQKNDGALYSIASYDNSLGKWVIVGQNNGETFKGADFNIVPGKGYLFKSKKDFTFSLNDISNIKFDTIYLGTGWNLIGAPNENPAIKVKSSDFLIKVFDDTVGSIVPDNITRWNRSLSKYEGVSVEYEESSKSIYGNDYILDLHSAYFVRVSEGRGRWQIDYSSLKQSELADLGLNGTLRGYVKKETEECIMDCTLVAYKTKVIIREITDQMNGNEGGSDLVKYLETNEEGFYSTTLPVGEYSVFIDDNGTEKCSEMNDGSYCPVDINNNQVTEYNFELSYDLD